MESDMSRVERTHTHNHQHFANGVREGTFVTLVGEKVFLLQLFVSSTNVCGYVFLQFCLLLPYLPAFPRYTRYETNMWTKTTDCLLTFSPVDLQNSFRFAPAFLCALPVLSYKRGFRFQYPVSVFCPPGLTSCILC